MLEVINVKQISCWYFFDLDFYFDSVCIGEIFVNNHFPLRKGL